jgi:hypothetical protein
MTQLLVKAIDRICTVVIGTACPLALDNNKQTPFFTYTSSDLRRGKWSRVP